MAWSTLVEGDVQQDWPCVKRAFKLMHKSAEIKNTFSWIE